MQKSVPGLRVNRYAALALRAVAVCLMFQATSATISAAQTTGSNSGSSSSGMGQAGAGSSTSGVSGAGASGGGVSQSNGGSGGSGAANNNSTNGSSRVQQAQGLLGNAGTNINSSTYQGSVVSGTATAGVMDLSLDEAVQRGLRQNLGIILQSSSVKNANGQVYEQLQNLLPTVNGTLSYTVQQVNLAAFGLKFPGLNPIIGPFQVEDFRASLTQRVVNVASLENYLAAKHNFQGAKLTAEDARGMVVLTVGNAYLLCIADRSRIEAVKSELVTSKVTLDQATASHEAGVSPKIDQLRAQVDYQNEQQNLISTENQFEKDKLALARTIGLPLDQKINLTDTAPYAALDGIDADTAFQQALKNRKDLAAYAEQLKAAELQKKSARAENYPDAKVSGDFGALGETFTHSHGTYTATAEIEAPILQVARSRGQQTTADANYKTIAANLSDQVQQINADIRSSLLDIQAAAKLVEAAKSNVDLATEALSEAQQRFRAGVSDNLPVSQAQTQTEQANDQYISALYQHNVAKLSLARAIGNADPSYKTYLGGK